MKSLLDGIAGAAAKAGAVLMEGLSSGVQVTAKDGLELLTAADLKSQDLLREELGRLIPEAGFAGEEGACALPAPPFWLVDPLDGTTNYAHGYPVFAVSIALVDDDGVSAGCVHDPSRGETFLACRGGGSTLNGCGVRTSSVSSLRDALLATGFPYTRTPDSLGFDIAPLMHFLGRARGIRRSGSAALDLSYVACGRLDGYWEQSLRPWDMAAGALLVREAGGVCLGWDLSEWTIRSTGAVACPSSMRDAMVEGVSPGG